MKKYIIRYYYTVMNQRFIKSQTVNGNCQQEAIDNLLKEIAEHNKIYKGVLLQIGTDIKILSIVGENRIIPMRHMV